MNECRPSRSLYWVFLWYCGNNLPVNTLLELRSFLPCSLGTVQSGSPWSSSSRPQQNISPPRWKWFVSLRCSCWCWEVENKDTASCIWSWAALHKVTFFCTLNNSVILVEQHLLLQCLKIKGRTSIFNVLNDGEVLRKITLLEHCYSCLWKHLVSSLTCFTS